MRLGRPRSLILLTSTSGLRQFELGCGECCVLPLITASSRCTPPLSDWSCATQCAHSPGNICSWPPLGSYYYSQTAIPYDIMHNVATALPHWCLFLAVVLFWIYVLGRRNVRTHFGRNSLFTFPAISESLMLEKTRSLKSSEPILCMCTCLLKNEWIQSF